jgi:hypothetical protein
MAAKEHSPSERHDLTLKILEEILKATRAQRMIWRVEKLPDTWYTATLGDQDISFRLCWYEATNQIGADPRMFEFSMPELNAIFAFGTEGADLLFEILGEAFSSWVGHNNPKRAFDWLTRQLNVL